MLSELLREGLKGVVEHIQERGQKISPSTNGWARFHRLSVMKSTSGYVPKQSASARSGLMLVVDVEHLLSK